MKITQQHIDFWVYYRAPKFIKEMLSNKVTPFKKDTKPNINSLIPHGNYGMPTKENDCAVHNTVELVRIARKRNDLVDYLMQICQNPGTVIGPEKRSAMAYKWLKMIELRKH